jgi:hypothetical protein
VANSLLASSPSLSSTVQSLNTAFSQPVCHQQTIRSVMSMGGNASPLAGTQSLGNTAQLSSALSGLSLAGGNSGVLMTSETVAPCLKGANRNKAKIREVRAVHSAQSIGTEPPLNALTPRCTCTAQTLRCA